jgi:hypothetical protein
MGSTKPLTEYKGKLIQMATYGHLTTSFPRQKTNFSNLHHDFAPCMLAFLLGVGFKPLAQGVKANISHRHEADKFAELASVSIFSLYSLS